MGSFNVVTGQGLPAVKAIPGAVRVDLKLARACARREDEIRAAIAAGANMFEVVGLQAALDASDMIEIDGTWQQAAAGR